MNFLAHIFLSGSNEKVIIGNFMGDFVKGKAWKNYEPEVQKGILLHRQIDDFTDSHEIVNQTKERLRPKYHHYAPVISDVFYDHFLASLWPKFHSQSLLKFTETFYALTDKHKSIIPDRAQYMLTYMRRDNWLFNYQFIEGINRALTGMSRRTPFDSKMEEASVDLQTDYEAYQKEFEAFFPLLMAHAKNFLEK